MSKTSDALFDEIKNHVTGIKTSINQLDELDLTENEKGNVQHYRATATEMKAFVLTPESCCRASKA